MCCEFWLLLGRRPPVLFTPMDNILRNLEDLSRTELVWLNTYLAGRLRALPPENEPQPHSLPKAATDVEHSVGQYLAQSDSVAEFASHSAVLYGLKVQSTDQVPLNIGRILSRRNGCFVSTTELLRCHAYTECLFLVILPKGIRVDSFCTPKRHFEIAVRIPICSPNDRPAKSQASSLTSLGENPMLSLDQDLVGRPSAGVASEDSHDEASDDVGNNDRAAELKHKGSDPQPVAVDGRGDTTKAKKGTTFHVSRVDQYGESDSTPGVVEGPETPVAEIGEELPQPVAVDGRGGALPSEITKHDKEHQQIERVTPTVEWTEKPFLPSQKADTLPLAIERGEATIVALSVCDGKDKCKDVAKDNSAATSLGSLPHCMQGSTCVEGDQEGYAGNKPWVSALSTCDILAPIPEADVAVDNGSNVEASNIVAKPKALPLKVSPAARKGLAKIVTSQTQPARTQSLLDGYVHGLKVWKQHQSERCLPRLTFALYRAEQLEDHVLAVKVRAMSTDLVTNLSDDRRVQDSPL